MDCSWSRERHSQRLRCCTHLLGANERALQVLIVEVVQKRPELRKSGKGIIRRNRQELWKRSRIASSGADEPVQQTLSMGETLRKSRKSSCPSPTIPKICQNPKCQSSSAIGTLVTHENPTEIRRGGHNVCPILEFPSKSELSILAACSSHWNSILPPVFLGRNKNWE